MNPLRYRPTLFFTLCMLVPWPLWFAAACISRQNPSPAMLQAEAALGITGLIAPALITAGLILPNQQLRADAAKRLLRTGGFPKRYFAAALLLLPVSMVLAQLVSLLFGYSAEQFHISGRPSFSSAVLSPWFVLTFAAAAEELAWHGYGTDALLSRFSLFGTSLLFTVYWALWHLPLGFIQGYYHSEVLAEGALYTANFVLSMIAFVLLGNWLYLKSGTAASCWRCCSISRPTWATKSSPPIPTAKSSKPVCCWPYAHGCCAASGCCFSPNRQNRRNPAAHGLPRPAL
ncbi:CPBP family intramembrane glutamic endopeptidase [Kingella potus]|uniref:CPBP family intramembrane glutamic endopeptidase n=1 Tax=Kingella potus TaxID=265175 RepID=UPI001FCFF5A2|nr:type II CAAX endopeptidase family protein [Kingella potus]UOP01686.1 CPBP family intramembrane metalloprotease [Kingella potus]